ncbi:hypothetical protein F8S09_16060 [Deinococcus sp. SDU3-2]|uniref:Uncharacterized protein n=1 Tax=Deinococcus terrestris TaxID=2651870 RepID=A0A7X1TST9_9DEIO|nr:hypothetical protein [Deinococcus terrestris]MPY68170.1 hypothetical protein [Deinococcus terrestris]
MAPDDRPLPPGPLLSVHPDHEATDPAPAEQGPAPTDAANRPAPPAPVPSGEGLDAEEVEALVGSGAEVVETNRHLARTEGLEPDTES